MSNKGVGKAKKVDPAKNALFFSNVGFWILAIVYFLLGPINTLVFWVNLGFDGQDYLTSASAAMAFMVAAVAFLGAVPIVMALGLNVIALVRAGTLPNTDRRKVLWQSGSILLAIPVTMFVILCQVFLLGPIGDWLSIDLAVAYLINLIVISIVLMAFVIVPIVKTRR